MKVKKITAIIGCLALAICCCSCEQTGSPTPLVSTGDEAWYNPYDAAQVVEITEDYALLVSESMTANIKDYAQSVDQNALSEIQTIEKSLEKYSGGTTEVSLYINSLRKLYHCLYGFYTFNSTDAMLDKAISDVDTAYAAMSKQNQAAYYKPSEADIRAAATNISAIAQ